MKRYEHKTAWFFDEGGVGKLTQTLTKRKTVKFSSFILWAHLLQVFRLVSISVKSPAQRTCMERQESRSEAEAPRYPSNDFFGSYTPPRKTPSRNYISPKNTWPKLHYPEHTFP